MMKISVPVVLLTIGVLSSSKYVNGRRGDLAIEALANEWIDGLKTLAEPKQSWAIEKVNNARTKEWNTIGDFYMELVNITREAVTENESVPAISKRETSDKFADSKSYTVTPFNQITMNMLVKISPEAQQSILQKKLDEAANMKWTDVGEYFSYCFTVLRDVTGIDMTEDMKDILQ